MKTMLGEEEERKEMREAKKIFEKELFLDSAAAAGEAHNIRNLRARDGYYKVSSMNGK